MNKKSLLLPVMALGTAGLAYAYLSSTKVLEPDISLLEEQASKKKLSIFRLKRKTTKVSRALLKILNNIDNNRLLFIEINTKSKKSRENILVQLEGLKTDVPVDDMWIADFYKQTFSRDDIIALTNKKAIFYLSNLEEVTKVKISARTTVLKMVGNSLSILSTKYPSLERYFFEPMIDIYAPLKETDGLNNLGTVAYAQLYRGGMPVGEHNYDSLADLGIKTVINLKIEDSAVEYVGEQNNLLKREIGLHYIPLPNVAAPTMQQAMEFLTIVYNTDMKPVFVHCHRGSDRTGIMAAVFRITQGYSAPWALVEAEKYNIASSFHHYKIEFVYDFEKNWIKWKSEGKIPNDLTNFDFINLMSIEESNDVEDHNINIEKNSEITTESE